MEDAIAKNNSRGGQHMNLFSFNQFKKVTKGTLALVLASTFTFSSLAFADETNTEQTNYPTVDLQEVQSQLESTQTETPSVIPGDFFYFAKVAFEKIKLAITFDNAKEAELMATYASERLAEAAALYGEGKEEAALEVIQTALEYMERSQSVIDEETTTNETTTEEQDSTVGDTEEAVTDENSNEEETPIIEDENTEQNPYTEAEGTLRNNIVALTAAMEHVGNDKARASLQKNIDKTYAKIAKKLAKLEKKYGKIEEDEQATDEATTVDPVDTVEAPAAPVENQESTNLEESEAIVEPTTEAVETAPVPAPVVTKEKQQVKQSEKVEGNKGKSAEAHQKNNERKENKKEGK
jgi:hypothetical protein